MKRPVPSLWILAWVALPAVADADVLILKDGKKLEGEIAAKGNAYEVKTPYGTLTVEKGEVERTVPASTEMIKPAEALRAEARERAKAGAVAEALAQFQQALDIYNETRSIYAGDPYEDLDESILSILKEMGECRSRSAAKPEATAPPEASGKAEDGPRRGEPKASAGPSAPAKPPVAAGPRPDGPPKTVLPKLRGISPAQKAKAEAGDPEAQYALALALEKVQYHAEALWWYREAGAQGLLKAQLRAATMYSQGRGTRESNRQEAFWAQKAADQGSAAAQANLGILYLNGWGVAKDEAKARKCFESVPALRKEAARGFMEAQCILGYLLAHGHGVAKNETEALVWYRKAAAQGHLSAMNNLGFMLDKGQGAPRNPEEACRYTRMAAEMGNPTAQTNLGVYYQDGRGVKKDLEQARMWYLMAAQAGKTAAIRYLKELNR